jgi:two-component system, LuxR family, response regulator FixJ
MSDQPFAALRDKGVVVIDDDPAVCESTCFLLETLNIPAKGYRSGRDFLAACPEAACVIVDFHMPQLNGLELIAEMRRLGLELPVIMITAAGDAVLEKRAAELGVTRVLEKPPAANALIGAIHQAVN